MENNELDEVGELQKRKEKMSDGERYIIYYTFDDSETKDEVKENV